MMSRILGFTGCCWMIFGRGGGDFYLSESGFPGFEDVQDVVE
jgi:hypothetical protein